jgi:hypothetical protein
MDLCTLGVFVGAILSTVRRAFFVWRRSASGTSQRGYDFKPPGFSHGSSYPENKLFRCSIQICLTPFACLCFRFWMVRRRQSGAYYLPFCNARVTGSTAVLATPCLGNPVLGPSRVGHPVNERIAGTSKVQCLAYFATAETTEYSRSRNEQGRAGGREAAKAAEEESPQSVKPADYPSFFNHGGDRKWVWTVADYPHETRAEIPPTP